VSTPVHDRGKLQGHGSPPTAGRMCLAELVYELIHVRQVAVRSQIGTSLAQRR
jgi:hypothetical protein